MASHNEAILMRLRTVLEPHARELGKLVDRVLSAANQNDTPMILAEGLKPLLPAMARAVAGSQKTIQRLADECNFFSGVLEGKPYLTIALKYEELAELIAEIARPYSSHARAELENAVSPSTGRH